MNKELLFEVDGFQVIKGSVYVVRDKEDLNAPTGFIKAGVTKLPSDGVDDTYQCSYKMRSATSGTWDTGFYEFSPCYANVKSDEKLKQIALLEKHVVKPYEEYVGESGILKHTNDEFWTKKIFQVYTGKVFDTSNPEELLALYFALRTRQVTPKEKKGDSSYKMSSYIILDINKDTKRKDEKSSLLFDAIGKFESIYIKDRQRLISSLNYLNLTVAEDIDQTAFRGLFNEWLNQRNGENVEMFLNLIKETEEDSGRAKVEIYMKLKGSLLRGSSVSRNPNGVYYYDEYELGPDLKTSANMIATSKELEPVKKKLLFLEEDDD